MLTLQIHDTDILRKLAQYSSDINEQETLVLSAIRLGLEAMTAIRGEIDRQSLQHVGQAILEQVEETVVTVLNEHRQTLLEQFSLDIPDSALHKLSLQLNQSYASVRDEVTKLSERRIYQRRSTQGGSIFEDDLGKVLQFFAQGTKDIFEPTGAKAGKKDKSKVGDFVITLGENCHAPGESIVIEAKRDSTYTVQRVLNECKFARSNRNAQVCLFVWDKESCGAKHPPLQRYQNDIIVLWDAADESTDVYIEVAFWLARSLITPRNGTDPNTQVHFKLLSESFDKIVQQSEALDKLRQSGERIIKEGNIVLTGCSAVLAVLEANIDSMRSQVDALSQLR